MTPSSGPITAWRPSVPSHVIQGYFPGGRPNILQASPVSAPPVWPQVRGPVEARAISTPAPILPGRPAPGAIQPALLPGQPPRPIVPTPSRPGAVQPAAPLRARVPQPILPQQAPRPATIQPQTGNAFALPANFTLKPRGSGRPLAKPIQQKMESFFNTSFADVRIHVGHEAPSIGASPSLTAPTSTSPPASTTPSRPRASNSSATS